MPVVVVVVAPQGCLFILIVSYGFFFISFIYISLAVVDAYVVAGGRL